MFGQYRIKAAPEAEVLRIRDLLGLPHFIAATLVARGVTDPHSAARFINPSLDTDWLDPYLIPGLGEVADALERCIRKDQHILVFGDFDLDGISATTVLTRGLRELGAHATPFIPLRFEEGYALTEAAFERARAFNPDFIVTVDCGIACKAESKMVLDAGIGLAVTDHHEPGDQVPEGIPIADPKLDENCKSSLLAGVGVALKLLQVLGARFGLPHLWRGFTDFAALGTVADLMPMQDENRALVLDGLNRMNSFPRACIAALLAASGMADKRLTSTNLSFSLVPRLNAAGRMGNAQLALDLLMCDSYEESLELAYALEQTNDHRRAVEAELADIACNQAEQKYSGQRALVVAGENWHEGVKGIIASRLVRQYGVPAILFSVKNGEARGSGRSVGKVNLFLALSSMADILTRFGGHEAAVGVTLPADLLPEFEARLCSYLEKLDPSEFHPPIDVDAEVSLDELTIENVEAMERLAPFGQANTIPLFAARNLLISNGRTVGADKNHFSCTLTDGKGTLSAIFFNCQNIDELLSAEGVAHAVFELQIDEWRGRRTVKAMLKALEPLRPCAALEACHDSDDLLFAASLYDASENEGSASATFSSKEEPDAACCEDEQCLKRQQWRKFAQENYPAFEDALRKAFIGDGSLHETQRQILDALDQGKSVLGIMATGRGKSLTFQMHALRLALLRSQASIFVYPLRALIADQVHHLNALLQPFGVGVECITGESSSDERCRIFAALRDGSCGIVLTTPEFLAWHVEDFAQSGRISFAAVDEAHHIAQAKAGNRAAYAQLGALLARLGCKNVLALTATADAAAVADIAAQLPIEQYCFDRTSRPNLCIDDQRGLKSRDEYLVSIVAEASKTIVYVNSREQCLTLARMLRCRLPHLAPYIGFYNADLAPAQRMRVEQLFREGTLLTLVATSAFGEGVNIPNVRHVVLYHLPFNEVEFNQMSGRAGRDGQKSYIHLLFGREDERINESILASLAPDHDRMAQVYRKMRSLQAESSEDSFTMTDEDLARAASTMLFPIDTPSVVSGRCVFCELGLIEDRVVSRREGVYHSIHVKECAKKVELSDSVRYCEGLQEQMLFRSFRDWAMASSPIELYNRISKPILPSD